jgi:hypothetical protein
MVVTVCPPAMTQTDALQSARRDGWMRTLVFSEMWSVDLYTAIRHTMLSTCTKAVGTPVQTRDV